MNIEDAVANMEPEWQYKWKQVYESEELKPNDWFIAMMSILLDKNIITSNEIIDQLYSKLNGY